MKFDLGSVSITKRKRLPHWRAQHAIYFITYNLYDAVPAHIKASFVEQAAAQFANIRKMRGDVTIAERNAIDEWLKAKIGETLDSGYGECFMSSPDVAAIVSTSLEYFDQERYELLSWSVMPNHVHVVMFPFEPVDRILHSWKSFTSKRANAVLERSGMFWQDDYYDTCIRDSTHLYNTIEYVANNPAAAGLGNWPFVRVYSERLTA